MTDTAPIAVVMITLNEAHNMRAVIENLRGWAQEIFLVDSYSSDETIGIALEYGVHVVQHEFNGFGNQWNVALTSLPIAAKWTMKIDPDERLSTDLKKNIRNAIEAELADGFSFDRQLWFMGRPLPVRQRIVRIWRTGTCRFTDVLVNEHPLVEGRLSHIEGTMEHYDSPHLHHWISKQNNYTTAEAVASFRGQNLAETPSFFGDTLQRRMWFKAHFFQVPLRYFFLFIYHFVWQGAWRSGKVGYIWSRLRCDVYRLREYKLKEMMLTGCVPEISPLRRGTPDSRVQQL